MLKTIFCCCYATYIFRVNLSCVIRASDEQSRWGCCDTIASPLSVSQRHGLLFWGEENHSPYVVLRGHSLQGNTDLMFKCSLCRLDPM